MPKADRDYTGQENSSPGAAIPISILRKPHSTKTQQAMFPTVGTQISCKNISKAHQFLLTSTITSPTLKNRLCTENYASASHQKQRLWLEKGMSTILGLADLAMYTQELEMHCRFKREEREREREGKPRESSPCSQRGSRRFPSPSFPTSHQCTVLLLDRPCTFLCCPLLCIFPTRVYMYHWYVCQTVVYQSRNCGLNT